MDGSTENLWLFMRRCNSTISSIDPTGNAPDLKGLWDNHAMVQVKFATADNGKGMPEKT